MQRSSITTKVARCHQPRVFKREIEKVGVAPKQTERARRVFQRSAQQAGFFAHGAERLVMPAFKDKTTPLTEPSSGPPKQYGRHGGDDGGGRDLHMLIRGLLEMLPEPRTTWADRDRVKWVTALVQNLDLIYEGADGEIQISFINKAQQLQKIIDSVKNAQNPDEEDQKRMGARRQKQETNPRTMESIAMTSV